MTYDRPPVYIPATPEFILEVLRDSHRQQSQFDPEADPCVELKLETTIDDWRTACDLVDAKALGRAINEEFDLKFSDDAWRGVLEPSGERTLCDVCELISSQGMRPKIEPVTILGSTCLPAGAFLAIRSLLNQAGADVHSIMPSTFLEEYTRLYPRVFLGPVSRLAPNALPDVHVSTPWYDLGIVGFLLGWLLAVAGFILAAPLAMGGGAILALASWLGVWIAARYIPPASVEFGNLRTFRDLAMVVASDDRSRGSRKGPADSSQGPGR